MAYVLMRWASRLQIHSDSTSPRRRGIKPLRGEQNKWDQDDTGIEQSVSESMTVCHLGFFLYKSFLTDSRKEQEMSNLRKES